MVITKTTDKLVLDAMPLSTFTTENVAKFKREARLFFFVFGGLYLGHYLLFGSSEASFKSLLGGLIGLLFALAIVNLRRPRFYKETYRKTPTGVNITKKTLFSERDFHFSVDDMKNLQWHRGKASFFGPDPVNGYISFDEEGAGEKFNYTVREKKGREIVAAIKSLHGISA